MGLGWIVLCVDNAGKNVYITAVSSQNTKTPSVLSAARFHGSSAFQK